MNTYRESAKCCGYHKRARTFVGSSAKLKMLLVYVTWSKKDSRWRKRMKTDSTEALASGSNKGRTAKFSWEMEEVMRTVTLPAYKSKKADLSLPQFVYEWKARILVGDAVFRPCEFGGASPFLTCADTRSHEFSTCGHCQSSSRSVWDLAASCVIQFYLKHASHLL